MDRPSHDAGRRSLRVIKRVAAVVAAGAVGRALWYSAVDALVIYVFGDPASERRERLASAASTPGPLGSGGVSERLAA